MGKVNLYFTSCLGNMFCRIDPLPNALLRNSYGIVNLLGEEEFVCARLIRARRVSVMTFLRRNHMSGSVLGVDIAKRKFDAALLVNGKLKHKVFKNDQEGFGELSLWSEKQGVDHVHVCMEASSTYGDELATGLHDDGYTVSIVNPATDQRICSE